VSVTRATHAVGRLYRSARGGATEEHVVHVGYHKTASTWLQLCVFPWLAGLRYGDPVLAQLARNLATAPDGSFFAGALRSVLRQIERLPGGPMLVSDEALSGSLWDGYGAGPRNAERLHPLVPRARILVIVRRQDEMLRSIHAQYVNEGGTRPLRAFVAGHDVVGSRFSLRHLAYDQLVGRYVELFGRDRVWVAPYEYVRRRPDRFIDDLCGFLGTTLTGRASARWHNRSLSKPSLWLLRTWNRLFCTSRFNPRPRLWPLSGGRHLRNLLQRHIDPVVRHAAWDPMRHRDTTWLEELAGGFADSNERLQRLCSYPLAEWGYPLPARPLALPAVAPESGYRADGRESRRALPN
jgi:hypothetical protein